MCGTVDTQITISAQNTGPQRIYMIVANSMGKKIYAWDIYVRVKCTVSS